MGNTASGGSDTNDVSSVLDELHGLEQKISSIHALQRQEVEALTFDRLAARTTAPTNGTRANSLHLFGSHLSPGSCKVLVGPVVGLVTENSARILLEVDATTDITCHICLFNAECPGGREIATQTVSFTKNRPSVFEFKDLPCNVKFHFAFSNVCRSDTTERTGSFKTLKFGKQTRVATLYGHSPGSNTDFEDDVFTCIAEKLENDSIDMVLHIGGQVDLRSKIQRLALMLERMEVVETDEKVIETTEKLILEELRRVYRFTWNLPTLRKLLANCSNLMMWSDLDMPTLPSRNTVETSKFEHYVVRARRLGTENTATYPATLLVLVQQVFRDYQRALWDPEFDKELSLGDNGTGNEETYFVKPHQGIGLLCLDSRGSQFNPDGSATPWPDTPISSPTQWNAVRKFLSENISLQTLLVVSDRPIVRNGYTIPNTEAGYDQWATNERDQAILLNLLFSWKSKSDVILVCGTGPDDLGSETVIRARDHARTKLLQVSVPPVTKCYPAVANEIGLPPPQGSFAPPTILKDDPEEFFHPVVLSKVDFIHTFVNKPDDYTKKPPLMFAEVVMTDGVSDPSVVKLRSTFRLASKGTPMITLGPIVGKVTDATVEILVEVDSNSSLQCDLTDQLSGDKISVSNRFVRAHTPCIFKCDSLRPDRSYQVRVTPATNSEYKVGYFHTMPGIAHVAHNIEHSITMFVVSGNTPTHLPAESESLWTSIAMIRDKIEPVTPTAVLHLGGQVDLEMISEDLRTVVRTYGQGRRPQDCGAKDLKRVNDEVSAVIAGLYRTVWNLPDTESVMARGCNLMMITQEDVREPECFKSEMDLIPWKSFIRQVAIEVGGNYQQQLAGVEVEQSRGAFKGLHLLGGGAGVVMLSSVRVAAKSVSCMLTPYEWDLLDEAIQEKCHELKSLVLCTDLPVIDDAPVDAKLKTDHFICSSPTSWAYYPDECLRLLDLIMAWKTERQGRDVLILTSNQKYSFSTLITNTEVKVQVRQVCVGPVTRALHPTSVSKLPFELHGTVDSATVSAKTGKLKETRYKYAHVIGGNLGENCVGVVSCGSFKRDGTCKFFPKIFSSSEEDEVCVEEEEQLRKVSAWMLGALAVGEQAKINRLENSRRSKVEEAANKVLTTAEEEIKEAYPSMEFPDENDNVNEEEAVEPPAPPPKIKDEDTEKEGVKVAKVLKWLDIDVHVYGDETTEKLKKWLDLVSSEEESVAYMEAVESTYLNYAEENIGVVMNKTCDMVIDFFTRNPPIKVFNLVFLQDSTLYSRQLTVRLACLSILKRRKEQLNDDKMNRKPLPFAEILPLCACVGALCILSL